MKNYTIFLILILILSGCQIPKTIDNEQMYIRGMGSEDVLPIVQDYDSNQTILIAGWNLQIFGEKKSNDEELMSYYVNKIDDYDIIIIQEIRNKSGEAFEKLCGMLPAYNCIVSTRAGTSSSKEQYGVIYKDVELIGTTDYNDENHFNDFERPPFLVAFKRGEWEFHLITIHMKPDDVAREMANLEKLLSEIDGEIIIMGDLNGDCRYYNEEDESHFDNWTWIIPNDADTTVSQTDCAYDRIIHNDAVNDNFVEYGIMKSVVKEQSDHYLIWGEYGN